jgi:hypothetical protein
LLQAQENARREAGRAGQEEAAWLPRLGAADAQAEQAYNTRLSELDRRLSPEYRASFMESKLSPSRRAYSAARSRLGRSLSARGVGGSSVEAGALAALENGRAASEAGAAGQLVGLEESRRDAQGRERLGLVSSWRDGMAARVARARAERLAAERGGVAAGSAAWAQDRQDDDVMGQNFGMTVEALAELLQNQGRKRRARFGGVPESSQGSDGEYFLD